jgi:hypothetical protein
MQKELKNSLNSFSTFLFSLPLSLSWTSLFSWFANTNWNTPLKDDLMHTQHNKKTIFPRTMNEIETRKRKDLDISLCWNFLDKLFKARSILFINIFKKKKYFFKFSKAVMMIHFCKHLESQLKRDTCTKKRTKNIVFLSSCSN